MTHSYVCHDPFVRAPWRISTCFMTHSFIYCESSIYAYYVWFIDSCVLRLGYPYIGHFYVCHDSFIHILQTVHSCLLRLIHRFMCAATRVFIYRTSPCVSWLIHSYTGIFSFVFAMTHSFIYVCRDLFFHMWDISHSYMITTHHSRRRSDLKCLDFQIYPIFGVLSDRDSVYSRETLFEKFGDFRENVFDMYGDSRENLLEVLAVVIILRLISSVRSAHKSRRLTHMWRDSFIRDTTRFTHMWRDSFIRDITHSCVTWLIHTWHYSFVCDVTHSYVTRHDSFICDVTHSYVTSLIRMYMITTR